MKTSFVFFWENVLIILAIFSLWPVILGWQGTVFKIIPYLALGAMVVIFVRRIGRVRSLGKKS